MTNHVQTMMVLAFSFTALSVGPKEQIPQVPAEKTVQLQSALSLDRIAYFPGEAGVFTLSVRNSESTPVEIPEPFSGAGGCFALRKLEGGTLLPLSAGPICPSRVVENQTGSTAVLRGGELRQAVFNFDTLASALDGKTTKVLNLPGYYQVEYLYHSRPAVMFRVVRPHLDAATVVQLPDISYADPATGRDVSLPAYLHVLALRWNRQTFICVSQSPESSDRTPTADARGDYPGADFPYVRVATNLEPVTSITATVDPDSRVTIGWLDTTGQWQMKVLDNTLPDPEPGPVQIGMDSTLEELKAAEARQFTATVIGSENRNLEWSVTLGPGAPAGVQAGAVSASGLYSAPARVTRPYRVILKARSRADADKSAIAMISLLPPRPVTTAAVNYPTNR